MRLRSLQGRSKRTEEFEDKHKESEQTMKRQWWNDKIAYQIYPKSFCDSNGDGIGDIPGIISKLDYLKSLGVDILWLSPCYPSPLADEGYDISDYYDIDPRFGTLEDMDTLIAEAKKRGMFIILDLVVNHCSDEHEWFRKACEDPDGKYGSYFYIEDRDPSGKLPCNWRSCFGGSVWEPLPGHPDKIYLHIFHKKQPDLNWENPEVREEVYRNICWWMDRGAAGFRIDAIINIKKILPYRDYPADRDDGLCDISAMLENVEGLGDFLGEMRDRTFIPNNAFTVGEVFNEKYDGLSEFIGEDGYFSSMFDFSHVVFGASRLGWYDNKPISTDDYKRCIISAQKRIGDTGMFSLVIENHDRPRAASYYLPEDGRSEAGKKCLALAYFMQRGLPFIYQGQEIGMENQIFSSLDEFDDISTIDQYKLTTDAGISPEEALKIVSLYSRDNARTPMQWSDADNAGFTDGRPWLPLNRNYRDINVKEQDEREDSLLNFYRKLTAVRKNPVYRETLVYGDFVPAFCEIDGLFAYHRKAEIDLLILANMKSSEQTINPGSDFTAIIDTHDDLCVSGTEIRLKGWQAVMLELS